MSTLTLCSSSLFLLLLALAPGQDGKAPADKGDKHDRKERIDFQKDVLPILEKNCLECHHSPDGKDAGYRPKGGVILDNKGGITTSKKGKLIVARKPEESVLYQAVTRAADAKNRMPPARKAEPLAKETLEVLKKWISDGAEYGTWTGKKDDARKDDKPRRDEPGARKDGADRPKRDGADKPKKDDAGTKRDGSDKPKKDDAGTKRDGSDKPNKDDAGRKKDGSDRPKDESGTKKDEPGNAAQEVTRGTR